MAMTESFASTAAQTIPVFALGAVVSMAALPRPKWKSLDESFIPFAAFVIALAIWLGVMMWDFDAEVTCLAYLRHERVSQTADGSVAGAMTASMLLLVVVPAVGRVVLLFLKGRTSLLDGIGEAAEAVRAQRAELKSEPTQTPRQP